MSRRHRGRTRVKLSRTVARRGRRPRRPEAPSRSSSPRTRPGFSVPPGRPRRPAAARQVAGRASAYQLLFSSENRRRASDRPLPPAVGRNAEPGMTVTVVGSLGPVGPVARVCSGSRHPGSPRNPDVRPGRSTGFTTSGPIPSDHVARHAGPFRRHGNRAPARSRHTGSDVRAGEIARHERTAFGPFQGAPVRLGTTSDRSEPYGDPMSPALLRCFRGLAMRPPRRLAGRGSRVEMGVPEPEWVAAAAGNRARRSGRRTPPTTHVAAYAVGWRSSSPFTESTRTCVPAGSFPASSMPESRLSTSRWMVRRSGRAPNSGW